jgi:hypothetical protein
MAPREPSVKLPYLSYLRAFEHPGGRIVPFTGIAQRVHGPGEMNWAWGRGRYHDLQVPVLGVENGCREHFWKPVWKDPQAHRSGSKRSPLFGHNYPGPLVPQRQLTSHLSDSKLTTGNTPDGASWAVPTVKRRRVGPGKDSAFAARNPPFCRALRSSELHFKNFSSALFFFLWRQDVFLLPAGANWTHTHLIPARPGKSTRLGTPGRRLGAQQFLLRH